MRLRLTVVDTPGYGDFINNEDGCVGHSSYRTICRQLIAEVPDAQMEAYSRQYRS